MHNWKGDNTLSEVDTAPMPMKELAFILGKFGWDTKFSLILQKNRFKHLYLEYKNQNV